MEIVGHTTLEVTMNVHGPFSLDPKREALDLPGGLFHEHDGEAK